MKSFPATTPAETSLLRHSVTHLQDTSPVDSPGGQSHRLLRAIRIVFWIFAIIAGASQAWNARYTMATDGISYLDIGDAFAHGHAAALINGYWSPLYPASIGLALATIQPAARNEFAVVHGLNFVIFLLAAVSFEFLLLSLRKALENTAGNMPAWFLYLCGYAVFLWASLDLITVSVTSPDMLLAAFVYVASGILVRIASGSATWPYFASFGAALGIGYIAKAPLFPLSFVFLGLALIQAARSGVSMRRAALALLTFAMFAGPLVFLLSSSKHRLTFGDSGKLNYAWYVDGATYRHWQGEPLGGAVDMAPHWTAGPVSTGIPAHPTRKLLESPDVFEFAGSTNGTYPVWFDPSYWNEGMRAPFNVKQQIGKVISNGRYMYGLLLNVHVFQLLQNGHAYVLLSPILILCFLALVYSGAQFRILAAGPVTVALILPAFAAIAMYLLVYSEPRHLAPFIILLYMACFASLRFPSRLKNGLRLEMVACAIVLGFTLTAGLLSARSVYASARELTGATALPSEDWQVVEGLRLLGLGEGARIGSLTYSNHDHVRWARLARAKIVAEMFSGAYVTNEDNFWKAAPSVQARVIEALRRAGAEAIVSRRLPPDMLPPAGWQRIGQTRYFVFQVSHA